MAIVVDGKRGAYSRRAPIDFREALASRSRFGGMEGVKVDLTKVW